jgi:hypothetical protein
MLVKRLIIEKDIFSDTKVQEILRLMQTDPARAQELVARSSKEVKLMIRKLVDIGYLSMA